MKPVLEDVLEPWPQTGAKPWDWNLKKHLGVGTVEVLAQETRTLSSDSGTSETCCNELETSLEVPQTEVHEHLPYYPELEGFLDFE